MRWPTKVVMLLVIGFLAPAPLIYAQNDNLSGPQARSASQAATEEEVAQLRQEVAELKAIVLRLAASKSEGASGPAHLVQANAIVDPAQPHAPASNADAPANPTLSDPTTATIASQKKTVGDPPAVAGWTGEHFRLTSSDGQFTLMPVGYLNGQYTAYKGDGAPPAT